MKIVMSNIKKPKWILKNCKFCWAKYQVTYHNKDNLMCSDECRNKNNSISTKEYFNKNGHHKGMLGKTHTEDMRKKMSERVKKEWANPNSKFNSEKHRQLKSDITMARGFHKNNNNPYSRTKCGWVEIGGKRFFSRSSWEANIGAYFELLKSKGEILDWEHEPQTFWFEEIKRGVRSYLPDYRITNNDGSTYFVEVKGWMDDKSKTKLKRMAKYYPEVKLDLIDAKRYRVIEKNKSIIPMWGLLDNQKKS